MSRDIFPPASCVGGTPVLLAVKVSGVCIINVFICMQKCFVYNTEEIVSMM